MVTLYPFQKVGVKKLKKHKGRLLLADEMGLGKTVQVLQYIHDKPKMRPVAIVCPGHVKYVWKKLAKEHYNLDVTVLSGRKTEPIDTDIVAINYEILNAWLDELIDVGPKYVVLDECHYIQNQNTIRTCSAQLLCKGRKRITAISGTPFLNRPVEFFIVLNLLWPKQFPSFLQYAMRYCKPTIGRWGWNYNGASHLKELNRRLTHLGYVRRFKHKVLKDLPTKARCVIPLDIDNRLEYVQAQNNFKKYYTKHYPDKVDNLQKAEKLIKHGVLRKLAFDGKRKYVLDWLDDFVANNDNKLVVYCVHRAVVEGLHTRYKKISLMAHGGVPSKVRFERAAQFNTKKKYRLFITTIKAFAEGGDLTGAHDAAVIEMLFTPGKHLQAEDRLHRIGTRRNVMIYYLIAGNTIEEQLCLMVQVKQDNISMVLHGKKVNRVALHELLEESLQKGIGSYGLF